jgi:hypothetical protein
MLIDPSLARGARREFLRVLSEEWKAYAKREASDLLRNEYLSAPTTKSFRRAIERARVRLGRLLPVSEVAFDAKSRGGWLAFSLEPKVNSQGAAEGARVRALMLRKGRPPLEGTLCATFASHAIDRVIQRARIVDLPPTFGDIEAINAEFADAVLFIGPALHVLSTLKDNEITGLHLLLPAQHGFFLGCFDRENGGVLIKTYVDHERMRDYEREALRELQRIPVEVLALCSISQFAPGWTASETDWVGAALLRAWRDFGWRLAEHERPQGLSDRAWASRDAAESWNCYSSVALPAQP